jgi:hypothetical protein
MHDLFILTDGFDDVIVLAAFDRKEAVALCERIVGVRAKHWSCCHYGASDKLRAVREVNEWFYNFYRAGREVDMDILNCMQKALEMIC